MIDIKAAAKNPAYALGAMLYGLQNPISTEDVEFKIDMHTFGSVSKDGSVCSGCAATCALQVVTGRSFAEHITQDFVRGHRQSRAGIFNTEFNETTEFEQCINSAREGCFFDIMDFFGHDGYGKYYQNNIQNDITMHTHNWQKKIPAFEKIINEMHEDNPDWERFTE